MLGDRARRRWTREVGLLVAILVGAFTYVGTAATGDVVVNEVAWMGTEASSFDEWIELYNTTNQAIELEGYALSWGDGDVLIRFRSEATDDTNAKDVRSTTIPGKGFYLLERTEDDAIADVKADLIYTGTLANGGESLTLTDADGNVVDTANGDGGDWPAGDSSTYTSMERIDPTEDGSDANWATNDGSAQNGQDADGGAIHGTPKAVNSVTPTNTAPSCDDVSMAVDEGTSGSVAPECSDPDGDELSYAIVDGPDHGTADVVDQELRYEPTSGYTGADAFTYWADDGRATSDTATVDVKVEAVQTEGDGDPDDDGTVDAIDARICLQIADGVGSFTSEQRTACDVDGDGGVGRDDADEIARAAIGLTDDLGATVWMAGVVLLGVGLALPMGRAMRSVRCGLAASMFVGLATLLSGCPGLIPALPDDAVGIKASVTSSEIRIEVQNMPNGGLAALEIADDGLTFDADALRIQSVDPAHGWTVLAGDIDNGAGRVQVVAVRPRGGTADGRVLTLPLQRQPGFSRGAADVAWDASPLTLGDAANVEIAEFRTGTQP